MPSLLFATTRSQASDVDAVLAAAQIFFPESEGVILDVREFFVRLIGSPAAAGPHHDNATSDLLTGVAVRIGSFDREYLVLSLVAV